MALVLWRFWTYSFLGYGLEKAFARLTHADLQVRKCCYLLPLCPMYGLGVLAVLALPAAWTDAFWKLALFGGLTATAVEYAVHWFYDRWFHVRFWDYRRLRGSVHGRVCPLFSLIWGVLLAALLPPVNAALTPWLQAIPPYWTAWLLAVSSLDAVLSAQVLLRTGDVNALRLGENVFFTHSNENEP